MILVKHQSGRVINVIHDKKGTIAFDDKRTIAKTVMDLARRNVTENIAWCDIEFEAFLELESMDKLIKNKKTLLSFGRECFLSTQIGYIEDSLFINVKKVNRYPTWLMSDSAGIVSSDVLNLFQDVVSTDSKFDYFLCSIAKLGMPNGLLCYSEPLLFKKSVHFPEIAKTNAIILFRFVKQHFKKRWLLLLFLNLYIHEKKLSIIAIFLAFFYKKRNASELEFCDTLFGNPIKIPTDYDVLIPTIGRKTHLFDFLQDINQQTILPRKVIIIEQNPIENAVSELGFISSKSWNFEIKHIFTHKAGACNARNLGLAATESFWTFMADDDISIQSDFAENVFKKLAISQTKVATINCHLKDERQIYNSIFQWGTFGSGCSFVQTVELRKCSFTKGFEHGFGEDSDFGIQLRNNGNDVLYFPSPKILHHKAPIGGFRTKQTLAWTSDLVQPKPSPTVMLYQMLHNSTEQILGYKTVLFFKFYTRQTIKNPVNYYIYFQKQWNRSIFWANTLKQNS